MRRFYPHSFSLRFFHPYGFAQAAPPLHPPTWNIRHSPLSGTYMTPDGEVCTWSRFVTPVQTFVMTPPIALSKEQPLPNKNSSMVTRQGCHHYPSLPSHRLSPQACCSTSMPALTLKAHYPVFRLSSSTEIRDHINAVRFTSSNWHHLISSLHPLPLSHLPVTTYILLTKEFLWGGVGETTCRKSWTSLDNFWHVTLWKEG